MTNEMKINKCGCGGEAVVLEKDSYVGVKNFPYYITCLCCGFSSCNYSDKENLIKRWNECHPEISTAMRTIQWLDNGESIHISDKEKVYYKMTKGGNIVAICKETGLLDNSRKLFAIMLLDNNWQLYEDPKYILGTFKEAREHLKDGKRASIIHSQEKIELELVRQKYGNYILYDKEKQYEFPLQDVDYDSFQWKLYED